MKIDNITAVILAGGKNSRIKQEKSLIRIKGRYIIDEQVKLLEDIFEKIILSTSKQIIIDRFPSLPYVEDEYVNCGPLGGIHAAMKAADTPAVFVFACDMPSLKTDLIKKQIEIFLNCQQNILVPRHDEGIEPLHAIYSINNLPYLEKCLKENKLSVRSFYRNSQVKYLDICPKDIHYFYNINTPKDLLSII